ncbi:hypothetical protein BC827DRAFT_1151796 [Russula dissimulans]|nr:hypothetical protein BC827DRAFT_1151796 [Russula dissimulans]
MRLSSVFAIFCVVASASPSLAISSLLSERINAIEEPATTTNNPAVDTPAAASGATSKAVVGGIVGTLASVFGSTVVNSIVTWIRKNHTARRDAFEFLDAQINEELAARAHHRRELLTRLLDNLD